MWGAASGANYATILQTDIYGRGGYSYGNYAMTKNQTIYVSVGGKGKEGSLTSINPGGWNGGGDGQWDHGDDESMAGGGGCCSIQKSLKGDGQLKNYESVKNADVLIVAGGGGGTNHRATNQYGGGEIAAASIRYVSEVGTNMSQATQTSGYALVKANLLTTIIIYIKTVKFLVAVEVGMAVIQLFQRCQIHLHLRVVDLDI